MINRGPGLVMDVDGTLCPVRAKGQSYADLPVDAAVLARLREYREAGYYIILSTSRQMNTHDGNLGKINADTAPVLIDWLRRHEVPFDELHLGKPWPGKGGFYVDDRAVRPEEFLRLNRTQISALLGDEPA